MQALGGRWWHSLSVQAPCAQGAVCALTSPGRITCRVTPAGVRSRGCRRLLGCDVYSFEFKINHIARHIRLPDPPVLGPAALARPPERRLPPLLVVNVQLPMYPVEPLPESLLVLRKILIVKRCPAWCDQSGPTDCKRHGMKAAPRCSADRQYDSPCTLSGPMLCEMQRVMQWHVFCFSLSVDWLACKISPALGVFGWVLFWAHKLFLLRSIALCSKQMLCMTQT